MTKEEKELLLKDICSRLPYRLRGRSKDGKLYEATVIYDTGTILASEVDGVNTNICCDFKPYLRSLSSMTKEEEKEYAEVVVKSQDCSYENNKSATTMINDWYLSKGFDVRGLIPMGLALETPEDMYKYKKGDGK